MGEAKRRRQAEDGQQKLVKLRSMPAEGMRPLVRREGGTYDLPVLETSPGVYLSTWAIHNQQAMDLIEYTAERGAGSEEGLT